MGYMMRRDRWEKMARAAVVLCPARWDEPFGIVFAEALACGTPIMSAPRGALPEIVRNGENGYLCETLDQFAAAVSRIGGIDRALCRDDAARRFSALNAAGEYESLYRELLVADSQPVVRAGFR